MSDVDRTASYEATSELGVTSKGGADDYDEYLADMILEMQRMAAESGRVDLAKRLLAAYELACGVNVGREQREQP